MSMTLAHFAALIVPVKREPPLDFIGLMLYQSNALSGEAGEVGNEVKKMVRDEEDRWQEVLVECGDALFYMERLLEMNHWTVEDAAEALLAKLDEQRAGP